MSNSIQKLMQSGSEESSAVERLADACLSAPKAIWLDREVKPISGEKVKIDLECKSGTKLFRESFDWNISKIYPIGVLVPLGLFICYSIASILSAPLLGIGLALKKISLLTDEKAKKYNDLEEEAIKKQQVVKEQQKQLEELKSRLEKLTEAKIHLAAEKLVKGNPIPVGFDTWMQEAYEKEIERQQGIKNKDEELTTEIGKLNSMIQELSPKIEQQQQVINHLFSSYYPAISQ